MIGNQWCKVRKHKSSAAQPASQTPRACRNTNKRSIRMPPSHPSPHGVLGRRSKSHKQNEGQGCAHAFAKEERVVIHCGEKKKTCIVEPNRFFLRKKHRAHLLHSRPVCEKDWTTLSGAPPLIDCTLRDPSLQNNRSIIIRAVFFQ